jgi:hypothetical protein
MIDTPIIHRAISIRQPWAWAILHAGKDVENRSATAIRSFRQAVGNRVMLHASNFHPTRADVAYARERFREVGIEFPDLDAVPYGGIFASAHIVSIVDRHRSPWFKGPWAMTLADVKDEPFQRLKGQVGLFKL